ncbi:hypothetical protein HOL21_03985 [Candidatus Woesearchaeota archaeon]|jgi:hypothetical protein|nr:hypothetical protein [Candidatus Woesearchaeota archaeon]MBT5397346.1 hypothetical protein [Candidatus Woesearchaeota archaeon]MBT5924394.1 hypothetical protein [Candidatus Woesearchaeota archaeon]MBT6367809.1 hypothetical protein [Candidatus Woesearchaeota archaeon]MBT7762746.1 hypothetical protein [Candidatus Woesearchaeota archaeon]
MPEKHLTVENVIEKVQRAAARSGIDDVVFVPGNLTNCCLPTSGAMRQSQYVPDGEVRGDRNFDLGYIVAPNGNVDRESFRHNIVAFAPERLSRFVKALNEEGLQPTRYEPMRGEHFYFLTDEDFRVQDQIDAGNVLYK